MTPNGPPRNPNDVPMVRHRWIFIAGIVFWVLLVVSGIVLIIHNLRDHVPFDFSFWVGLVMVVLIATMLMRAGRFRRNARSAAALDRSRH